MAETPRTIIYTHTDEAPALATASLLPIIQAFSSAAGVDVELRDISLAARVLASFPDLLARRPAGRRRPRRAGRAGDPARGQHHQAAQHLGVDPAAQGHHRGAAGQGLRPARLPRRGHDAEESDVKARYDKVKGSAVNPVLREGNSDRRAPASVKSYARSHPHSMGAWSPDSKTRVAHMDGDDFRSNEQSVTIAEPGTLQVELVGEDGTVTVLKDVDPGARGRGRRRHRHERRRAERRSSPRRSPRPRPRACCSRSTSRPR